MECAFVIGNGKSRLDIDLETLRGKGKIYGCNYLYEDFIPDVLVATDLAISTYIQGTGYAKNNIMYTREPNPLSGAHKIEKNWGFSSGPVAATLAAIDGHRYIYLIGMDLQGLESKTERKFNNVYADREFYKTSDREETHYNNWIKQLQEIMHDYQTQTFIRVNAHLNYHPSEWVDMPNYKFLKLEQFHKSINTL